MKDQYLVEIEVFFLVFFINREAKVARTDKRALPVDSYVVRITSLVARNILKLDRIFFFLELWCGLHSS